MKTSVLCLLLGMVLISCEDEHSQTDAIRRRLAQKEYDNNNPVPGQGTSTDAPIDGGLSILLVAGAAYGARRIHKARKQNKQDEGSL
jgi:hypothetical protein